MADARRRARHAVLPLLARFPGLVELPRASIIRWPTPVVHAPQLAPGLWIKRDDLTADPLGGNKVRALEFLMANADDNTTFVTVGSVGSTHALAVATCARRSGAKVLIGRWKQEMNSTAQAVSDALESAAPGAPAFRGVAAAYAWAALQRARGARWIPAGGSSPVGVLGHVNAALELGDQIAAGVLPEPRRIVVPLGTGGTLAGLLLGARIAGLSTTVIGVRVVPRAVANRFHVARLARRTARLIERRGGSTARVPRVRGTDVVIDQQEFGGAYGRETPRARDAARQLQLAVGLRLDLTYSAKAAAAALALALNADGPTLLWLTYDARGV